MAVSVKMGVDLGSFNSNIQQARQQIKTLDAEMKLAESTFKATGNAEQAMGTKLQALNSKMGVQKQMVDQYKAALQQMTEAGVDPTSTAYQKMAQQMLSASAAMMDTQTQLNNLNSGEQQAASGADSLTSSLAGISKNMSLDSVISGISSITSGLESAASKALSLASSLWDTMMDAASWGDDIATQATIAGMSIEQYQKVVNVAAKNGETSTSSLIKAWKKVKMNLTSDSADVASAFKTLGVNTWDWVEDTGFTKTKDYMNAYWEIGEKLLAMSEDQTKAAQVERLAQTLLGRSWEESLPMFKMGREAYEAALEEEQTVTEENVNNLAELNDKVTDVEQKFTTFKNTVLGEIAPSLTKVADAVSNLMTELNEYLASEDGQKMLNSLSEGFDSLLESITNINTEELANGIIRTINSLVQGFQYIVDKKDDVIGALKTIVGAWAGLKITGGLLTLVNLFSNIQMLVGGGAAAAGGAASGITGGISSGLSGIALKASGVDLTGLWNGGFVTDWFMHNTTAGRSINPEYGGSFSLSNLFGGIWEGINEKVKESLSNDEKWESGELFSWLDKDSQKRHAQWEDQQEETQYHKEKYETEDMNAAVQQAKEAMEELDRTNAHLWAQTGGLLSDAEMKKLKEQEWLTGHTTLGRQGGENPEVTVEPVAEDGSAEKLAEQIGTVNVNAKLTLTGLGGTLAAGLLGLDLPGHANGLPWVPYDGYLALLHRGERVLTAGQNKSYTYNSNNYFGNVNLNNGMQIEALCDSIERHNRQMQEGYGA